MIPTLGLTRNVIRPHYALITPDGHVPSMWPGWTGCTPYVLISSAMGAAFSQSVVAMDRESKAGGATEGDEWFFYVVSGKLKVNGRALSEGGFAYVPPGADYQISGVGKGTTLLIFRKAYEVLAGQKPPEFFTGTEQSVEEKPFLGDERARLKILIPDTPAADMAVNIFTYDPGATLPFVETHVMEHGMLFLAGSGVYRLGEDWHPVTRGDVLWIAPYCPQWFIAAGPEAARYIYYKDVNRLPA